VSIAHLGLSADDEAALVERVRVAWEEQRDLLS